MSTQTTSSILSQAAIGSPAGIQAWTGEFIGVMLACGLIQTNDTGQLTITGSGGTAISNATQPVSTGPQSLYAMFTFNDALAGGNLATTALNSGGSGYTGGPYTLLTATGATSGATAHVSVSQSGGVCGNLSSIATLTGKFIAGEKITVAGIAGGSGANWTAASLSSGSPVIFRVDFGGFNAVTTPGIWVTLGQGTNGAGTISGTAGTTKMTQVACGSGSAPVSTITSYPSYYCYNSTQATCLAAMKFGATSNCFSMGFYIHRSNDSTGAPTGTSVSLYSSSVSTGAPGPSYETGIQQTLNYSTSVVYPTIGLTTSSQWPAVPQNPVGSQIYGLTSTLESSTIFIFNAFYFNPGFSYSAFLGLALLADIPNGTAITTTLVGTESVTLISLQNLFGVVNSPLQVAGVSVMAVFS